MMMLMVMVMVVSMVVAIMMMIGRARISPWRGSVDAEIKLPSDENPERSKSLSFKQGVV